jgi:hypothetical protein
MRFQLTLVLLLAAFSSMASDDQNIKELFKKYEQIVNEKKTELVEEVFTKKFLKENGGKDAFVSKLKKSSVKKSNLLDQMTWNKGNRDQMFLAKLKTGTSEFIIIKEDGKLKIDGTLSDAD